ncbi:MAG: RNA methyltransferase [Myxococcales bacterium FL481]|nr:MAG: RNA methyltransferase [Myxococcales bacterium FL481]
MLDHPTTERILAELGAERIVETLAPYLSEHRRERIEAALRGRVSGVHVAVEEPYDPHNAAAVVRSVEAFGAAGVHVIRASERVLASRRTTQGAFHWVERGSFAALEEFFAAMHQRGLRVYGGAMDGELTLDGLPVVAPICLLFGNEHRGLSAAARARCDGLYRIPMFGFSESLNLSVSAAVSLYDVLRRRRAHVGRDSDLEPEEYRVERARCYLRAVDPRFAVGLVAQTKRSGPVDSP